MKISLNQSLSLVLITMMGLTFSACTGVTETSTTTTAPTTTTNTQPAVNTPPAATFVTESPLPEKYRPLLKKAEQGNVKAQFAVATIFHGNGALLLSKILKKP